MKLALAIPINDVIHFKNHLYGNTLNTPVTRYMALSILNAFRTFHATLGRKTALFRLLL